MTPGREDVIIIGAGPAGIAAGIQLKRSGLNPVLIERDRPGGLLWNAHRVENYPGFPGAVAGPDLIRLFRKQLAGAGLTITSADVRQVSRSRNGFRVDGGGEVMEARAVIVASGTVPRQLPPARLGGCDLSIAFYEPRDIPSGKRNRIAIIGGGDAAFDYALGLAGDGCTVDIFFHSSRPRALGLLVQRARDTTNIRIHPRTSVVPLSNRDGKLVMETETGNRHQADVLLIAIGRDSNMEFLDGDLREEIRRAGPEGVPGLILAGDVRRGHRRQVAIAVGDGVAAAMRIASAGTERQSEAHTTKSTKDTKT